MITACKIIQIKFFPCKINLKKSFSYWEPLELGFKPKLIKIVLSNKKNNNNNND